MNEYVCISDDVKLGKGVELSKFINLYGCTIGENTKIGAFVEVQKNAVIGKNCKISSHTFICEGVNIGDNCFIGHGVMFINDSFSDGSVNFLGPYEKTIVEDDVIIGSNASILPVKIVSGAIIGAGSVVTKDILEPGKYVGNPAKRIS